MHPTKHLLLVTTPGCFESTPHLHNPAPWQPTVSGPPRQQVANLQPKHSNSLTRDQVLHGEGCRRLSLESIVAHFPPVRQVGARCPRALTAWGNGRRDVVRSLGLLPSGKTQGVMTISTPVWRDRCPRCCRWKNRCYRCHDVCGVLGLFNHEGVVRTLTTPPRLSAMGDQKTCLERMGPSASHCGPTWWRKGLYSRAAGLESLHLSSQALPKALAAPGHSASRCSCRLLPGGGVGLLGGEGSRGPAFLPGGHFRGTRAKRSRLSA